MYMFYKQCMYTQSLFTSTCIHVPHQHLLSYFSHKTYVYTHMFTLTFIWLKYCWYDIKQQIINQSITLFISECIHFYIMVVYSSILVWCTVASPVDISALVKNSWVGRKTPNKQMNEASYNSVLCDISVLLVSLFSVFDISLPAYNYCCDLY